MNNIAEFYNCVDMVENVIVSDSVAEMLCIENQYEDFKFVTKQPVKFGGPVEREVTYVSASWNFAILFVVMIFIVLNKFMSRQKLSSVISKPFQSSGGERVMRDNPSLFNLTTLSVVVSFILMFSLFIQKIFIVYGENRILYDNFYFFVDIVTCIAAVLVFNYLLTSFYGWLFKTDSLIYYHFTLYVSSMATCNLLLIPIVLLLFFHPYKLFLLFTLVIIGVFFLITFVKILIEVRMLSKLNFVNIFLYLCTIEILPVLVISKMIVNVL